MREDAGLAPDDLGAYVDAPSGRLLMNLVEQLTAPPALSVVFFMLGLYCFTTALAITGGIQFGKLFLPDPKTRVGKIIFTIVGVVSITFGVVLAVSLIPEYKPIVFGKLIYAGNDAKQVISDGEDVYLLKDNGNIFRIGQNGLQLIDDGTGTKQIAPAGGVIYILKENGNIWAHQWVAEKPVFELKDPGTGTKQIIAVGELLYVLKDNGNIWKYITRPKKNASSIKDDFIRIDSGTGTNEISSSGALLYVLKQQGDIWQYAPIHRASGPYTQIYKGDDEGEQAISIDADGGSLYFIRGDGTTWQYQGQLRQIRCGAGREIDALAGIVYVLTTQGTICRYISQTDDSRLLREAGSDNAAIAAYGPDIFVIKSNESNGNVWRYNEGLLRR